MAFSVTATHLPRTNCVALTLLSNPRGSSETVLMVHQRGLRSCFGRGTAL